jgi:hypothetical protein
VVALDDAAKKSRLSLAQAEILKSLARDEESGSQPGLEIAVISSPRRRELPRGIRPIVEDISQSLGR